ncbi:unknown [Porphyromonas sp. CAG:1061]|nr:unknown [Porphyromonas sp. CAG:1061]
MCGNEYLLFFVPSKIPIILQFTSATTHIFVIVDSNY